MAPKKSHSLAIHSPYLFLAKFVLTLRRDTTQYPTIHLFYFYDTTLPKKIMTPLLLILGLLAFIAFFGMQLPIYTNAVTL